MAHPTTAGGTPQARIRSSVGQRRVRSYGIALPSRQQIVHRASRPFQCRAATGPVLRDRIAVAPADCTQGVSAKRVRARVEAGNQRTWPADKVERWAIERLIPYAKNARTHTDAQVAAIAASIKEWGWTSPALVGELRTSSASPPP